MSETYLFTVYGDGAHSKVLNGLDAVYRYLIESMFGSFDDATVDELKAWNALLCDPDEWQEADSSEFWCFSHDFEDGGIAIHLIDDATALLTKPDHSD